MAPNSPTSDATAMVPALVEILSDIAAQLSLARDALYEVDDANEASLIATSIGAIGWLADRALALAGSGQSLGGADAWLLSPMAKKSLATLGASAPGLAGRAQEG